jgi:hypothetical protein
MDGWMFNNSKWETSGSNPIQYFLVKEAGIIRIVLLLTATPIASCTPNPNRLRHL